MPATIKNSMEKPRSRRRPAILFITYLALFAGFVALNILEPEAMSATEIQLGADHVLTLWGTNLALACGFGMLLAAVFFSWLEDRSADL